MTWPPADGVLTPVSAGRRAPRVADASAGARAVRPAYSDSA